MTCLSCAHGALRDAKDQKRDGVLRRMAALGLVNCERSALRASFHAPEHRCERWAAAPAGVEQARREWFERRALCQ